jgi:Tol biopolymer transport system component
MTMRRLLVIVGVIVTCGGPLGAGQQLRDPEVLFQTALYKEQVELKLDDAIAGYKEVVSSAGGNKTIAAKALLQMAGCYERLGNPAALPTYELIVKDYPATNSGAAARTRVAAITQSKGQAVAQRVWETQLGSSPEFAQPDVVSRDGGYMSFLDGHNDVGIRDLKSGRIRMLTRKGGVTESWSGWSRPSPDGSFVAYDWWDSDSKEWELRIVSRDGGEPRILASEKPDGRAVPLVWSPDSRSILVSRQRQLLFVPINGGSVRIIKWFNNQNVSDIQMSPDGRFIAVSRAASPGKSERDVFVLAIDSGREARLTTHAADDYMLGWLPDGQILFASDRDGAYGIWSQRVVDGQAVGDPIPVRQNTGKVRANGVTRQGELYYGSSVGTRHVYTATIDPVSGTLAGKLEPFAGRYNAGMVAPLWSPTGDRLAYLQFTNPASVPGSAGAPQNESQQLAIQTIATGDIRMLPLQAGEFMIQWTPDGRRLVSSYSRPPGRQELSFIDVETGARTPIADRDPGSSDGLRSGFVLSPDGRRLYFQFRRPLPDAPSPGQPGPRYEAQIRVRDLDNGREQGLTNESTGSLSFSLSPDGKWLIFAPFQSSMQGAALFVTPSSGGETKPLAGTAGWTIGQWITWSADGRSVFLVKQIRDKPNELWQVPVDGSNPRFTGISSTRQFGRISAHPDGRRLAIGQVGNSHEIWVLKNIPTQPVKK